MKLILAALTLLMMSNAAFAYSEAQRWSVEAITLAQTFGTEERCPRLKLIQNSVYEEMKAAELTSDQLQGEELADHARQFLIQMFLAYNQNPSKICNEMLGALGPHGTYMRQMLEEK